MPDKIAGYLEVGLNRRGEVVINHPKPMDLDEDGIGHFVFSANQARALADRLWWHAEEADKKAAERMERRQNGGGRNGNGRNSAYNGKGE